MFENTYDLKTRPNEDGDYQLTENSHPKLIATDFHSPNSKRHKVSIKNFYSIFTSGNLPVAFSSSRPQSGKNQSRPTVASAQNSMHKNHERHERVSSQNHISETEKTENYRKISLPVRLAPNPQKSPRVLNKGTPKNILHDKEELYEEMMSLKHTVRDLKDENVKLKTKVTTLEKETSKIDKIKSNPELVAVGGDFVSKVSEGHFVMTLKNKVKELKAALEQKTMELEEIKRSVKFTKIHELEIQLKAFSDETARMKKIVEHIVKERAKNLVKIRLKRQDEDKTKLQEQYFIQATLIKNLRRDKEEMIMVLQAFEQKYAELEDMFRRKEKKFGKDIQRYKRILSEKEKENLKLKNELQGTSNSGFTISQISGKRPLSGHSRDEFPLIEIDKKNISVPRQSSERNVHLPLHDIHGNISKASDKNSLANRGQNNSTAKPQSRASSINDLGSGGKGILNHAKTLEEPSSHHQFPSHYDLDGKEDATSPNLTSRSRPLLKKRLPRVAIEDIKPSAYGINLMLRIKSLDFDDAARTMWPAHAVETNKISVKELSQILKKEPFGVKDEGEALLFARYLIEDPKEEYVYYDANMEGDITKIQSDLKTVVGNIPKWTREAAEGLQGIISNTCIKHHGSLRENLRALCKSGYLTKRVLQDVCRLIDVYFTEEQIEFILTKLFERSQNVNKLSVSSLFEIFCQKENLASIMKRRLSTFSKISTEGGLTYNDLMNSNPRRLSLKSFTSPNLMAYSKGLIRESEHEDDESLSATNLKKLKESTSRSRMSTFRPRNSTERSRTQGDNEDNDDEESSESSKSREKEGENTIQKERTLQSIDQESSPEKGSEEKKGDNEEQEAEEKPADELKQQDEEPKKEEEDEEKQNAEEDENEVEEPKEKKEDAEKKEPELLDVITPQGKERASFTSQGILSNQGTLDVVDNHSSQFNWSKSESIVDDYRRGFSSNQENNEDEKKSGDNGSVVTARMGSKNMEDSKGRTGSLKSQGTDNYQVKKTVSSKGSVEGERKIKPEGEKNDVTFS